MSRLFGVHRQNGYVVESLDEAVRHWAEERGVGPFFVLRGLPLVDFIYRGEAGFPELDVALAYFGDVQIEGSTMEISDTGTSETIVQLSEMIRMASVDWDGADPVREIAAS